MHKFLRDKYGIVDRGDGRDYARWFLSDVRNVDVFHEAMILHGAAITEVVPAPSLVMFFETLFEPAVAADDDDDTDDEDVSLPSFPAAARSAGPAAGPCVLRVLGQLLSPELTESTTVSVDVDGWKLSADTEQASLQAWLLMQAAESDSLELASSLLHGSARDGVAPLLASRDDARVLTRWVSRQWVRQYSAFFRERRSTDARKREYWLELLSDGHGFGRRLEFVLNDLRHSQLLQLLETTTTDDDVARLAELLFPFFFGTADDDKFQLTQIFVRRCFEIYFPSRKRNPLCMSHFAEFVWKESYRFF